MRFSLRTLIMVMLLGGFSILGCKSQAESATEKAGRIERWKADFEKQYGEVASSSLRQEYFAAKLPLLLGEISEDASITIYEGLPHDHFEKELLQKELATKRTVEIHGFPFYSTPIEPKHPTDAAILRRFLGLAASYQKWAGNKLCGGYHPDWAIGFEDGDKKVQILLCFGCEEARIYGSQGELWTDLNRVAVSSCTAVLQSYRNQRPTDEE